jgi:hypothetical protein
MRLTDFRHSRMSRIVLCILWCKSTSVLRVLILPDNLIYSAIHVIFLVLYIFWPSIDTDHWPIAIVRTIDTYVCSLPFFNRSTYNDRRCCIQYVCTISIIVVVLDKIKFIVPTLYTHCLFFFSSLNVIELSSWS